MKVLQILKELEANPNLLSEKYKELNERIEELQVKGNVLKSRKTKLMNIMNMAPTLGATQLIKLAVELRKTMRDYQNVQSELKAVEYFKTGSTIERIEFVIPNTLQKWAEEAEIEYKKLFDNGTL